MKRLPLFILGFITVFLQSTAFGSSLVPDISSLKEGAYLRNVFGIPKIVDGEMIFQMDTQISFQNSEVRNLQGGRILYFDNPAMSFLPYSYGHKGTVVLEDTQNQQWQYNQLQLSPQIPRLSFMRIERKFPLGILESPQSFFSLYINRNGIFLNPLQLPDFPLLEKRVTSIHLAGALIESGIYIRYVKRSIPQRIPLRSNYTFFLYAYEIAKAGIRALPKSIHMEVKNMQSQQIVFHQELNFLHIQNNALNGRWSPFQVYRTYAGVSTIRLGQWKNMDRMAKYTVHIVVTGGDGKTDSLDFPLEFY